MFNQSVLTETELIMLAQDGNKDAFGELYEQHLTAIQKFIRSRVNESNEADDLAQTVFIKAFHALERYRPSSVPFRAWLYRIATNEALNALKKMRKNDTTALVGDEIDLSERLTSDTWFDGDAAEAKLLAAVNTLPDKQRAVFNLRYHEDLSYADISVITGTSVGALKASYHHAVKKIESYLTEQVS